LDQSGGNIGVFILKGFEEVLLDLLHFSVTFSIKFFNELVSSQEIFFVNGGVGGVEEGVNFSSGNFKIAFIFDSLFDSVESFLFFLFFFGFFGSFSYGGSGIFGNGMHVFSSFFSFSFSGSGNCV
jgi:hypothetical protein